MEWGIRFSVRQFWWMCMSQAVKSLEPPNDRIPLTLNMTRTKRLAECGRNAELELDRVQKVINPWLVSHVDLKLYSWFHSISFHSIPCVRIQKSHFLSQTYSQTMSKSSIFLQCLQHPETATPGRSKDPWRRCRRTPGRGPGPPGAG
jgi:hypothetical protein